MAMKYKGGSRKKFTGCSIKRDKESSLSKKPRKPGGSLKRLKRDCPEVGGGAVTQSYRARREKGESRLGGGRTWLRSLA